MSVSKVLHNLLLGKLKVLQKFQSFFPLAQRDFMWHFPWSLALCTLLAIQHRTLWNRGMIMRIHILWYRCKLTFLCLIEPSLMISHLGLLRIRRCQRGYLRCHHSNIRQVDPFLCSCKILVHIRWWILLYLKCSSIGQSLFRHFP